MAQIRQVVSESLQATVRRLLPSQQGFTEDLQASNVITPIIDLTPTAEGSVLPYELQTAISFGGITTFTVIGTTSDIITNAGFYRVFGAANLNAEAADLSAGLFNLNDGSTDKSIINFNQASSSAFSEFFVATYDFTVFLPAGHKLTGTSQANGRLDGSFRQIADVNGNLTDPNGFTPQ